MKTKFYLIGMFTLVTLVTAASRTWVFQTGVKFEGDYVSSGTTTVVVNKGGTNYFLKISELSTNDQAYIAEMQAAQKKARLNAETKQMSSAGWIKLTAKYIENFPTELDNKKGWMDAEFERLDPYAGRASGLDLGFDVTDKNGDLFGHCCVEKEIFGPNFLNGDENDVTTNALVGVVMNLKQGDEVRLIGTIKIDPRYYSGGITAHPDFWFVVQKIEMIESAAEKRARDHAADKHSDISQ